MAVTPLDSRVALVAIDLQKGIVAYPTVHPIDDVFRRTRLLADAFRHRRLPVVLVNVAGGAPGRTEQPRHAREVPPGWTDLASELNLQPQDHVVTKHTPGAFTATDLEAHLRKLHVTQIVMAGVATSNGVEVTARQAYELGFNVAFATDAMTDVAFEAHTYSITRVFPKIGETGTAEDIIALLEGV
jgi:nicotinamidase-related amidase